MGTEAPKPELSIVKQRTLKVRNLFEQQRPELAKLLPKGMDADRLFRMALTECVKQPKLLECTAESWALAIQVCAAQGLYPDSGLGYMYLVARNNRKKNCVEVSAMRGYQGDIKLCRNTGELADIYAEVVHEKDEYRVVKGLNRDLVHVPYEGDDDPGKLIATYAVAKLKNGETAFVTLRRRDVERHRASSESWDKDWSPWQLHTEEMWKKTSIHALAKFLPKANEEIYRADQRGGDVGETIDITPVLNASIPLEPARGLAAVTERLEEEAGGEIPDAEPEPEPEPLAAATEERKIAPKDCPHKSVPPSRVAITPKGTTVVCVDCGEEWPGEAEDEPATVAEMAPKKRRLSE